MKEELSTTWREDVSLFDVVLTDLTRHQRLCTRVQAGPVMIAFSGAKTFNWENSIPTLPSFPTPTPGGLLPAEESSLRGSGWKSPSVR